MNKPKIGSKVKVLCIFDNVIYFGEGIVKGYYNYGCTLFMVKEFARVHYNHAKLGYNQDFAEGWIELAKDDKALKKVKGFLYKKPLVLKADTFIFR
jgi:hypothetical protein